MTTKTNMQPVKPMRNNFAKLVCGLVLLGAVGPAVAAPLATLVAGWNQYTPSSQSFPYASSVLDASAASATMDYSGLFGLNDNRGVWSATNSDSTLDIATAPYLAWTLNLASGANVSNLRFFANLAKIDSNTKVELRSSLDNYATSLGDLSSVNGSYQNYLFSVPGVVSDSVTVRLFAYNVSAGFQPNWYDLFNVACYTGNTTFGGVYDANMDGRSAGFLATVAAPVPEPSTLALSVLGVMGGWFKLRRRK
jgi:hypothetical protein